MVKGILLFLCNSSARLKRGVHLEGMEPAGHIVVCQARFRSAKTQQY
ncbi:MAG: hypothetical protein HDR01_12585 [Lachnospiraceae bacterium]|nr:hypothetical protein [Lachnospiraceae bacterium]